MKAHLRKIVPSLAEIRKFLPSVPFVSWDKLRGASAKKPEPVYGHLVALPFEEKMKPKLSDPARSEADARDAIRARMSSYFHKLRVHHCAVRDITLLCAWWRLDAYDSPEYVDMQISLFKSSSSAATKAIPLTHSEEFLRRTRTFDVSERQLNSFERGTDAVAYAQARKLFEQECMLCSKYAALQAKAVTINTSNTTKKDKVKSQKIFLGMSETELRRRAEKYIMEVEADAKRKLLEKAEQTARDAELLL